MKVKAEGVYMETEVERIAKKHDLAVDQAKRMIIAHHELDHLIPKKNLKKVELNIKGDGLKLIAKYAKALKISHDAVIITLLRDYMDKNPTAGLKVKDDKKI